MQSCAKIGKFRCRPFSGSKIAFKANIGKTNKSLHFVIEPW